MKPNQELLLIGDVHGKQEDYLWTINYVEKSLQLGDMGFSYETIAHLNPDDHCFFAGNHDNYHKLPPQCLQRGYGVCTMFPDSFYIRGAWSIDKAHRIPGISWWAEEELSWEQQNDCLEEYITLKPRVVFSHDCPEMVAYYFYGFEAPNLKPSSTVSFLEELFLKHQPEIWVFGHHHRTKRVMREKTTFQCLNELDTALLTLTDGELNLEVQLDKG